LMKWSDNPRGNARYFFYLSIESTQKEDIH
jgi:hypothetical protein